MWTDHDAIDGDPLESYTTWPSSESLNSCFFSIFPILTEREHFLGTLKFLSTFPLFNELSQFPICRGFRTMLSKHSQMTTRVPRQAFEEGLTIGY